MWCLSKISICILFVLPLKNARASDVSFQDVTVDLVLTNNTKQKIDIKSFENLKKNLPNLDDGQLQVTVSGSIPILYENSVSDLNKLMSISLANIGLQEMKPGSFRNLRLKVLSLNSNKLEEIRGGTFENVTFTDLILHHNQLKTIYPGAFKDLDRFYTLNLASNEFEEISPESFNNPDIDFVNLKFNSISTLRPGDLRNLPNLRNLELGRNKLTEIPEGVFNNTKLSSLKLSYNQISKIAKKAFNDMPYLNDIYIDHNKLARWDNTWLFNTPWLVSVFASNNLIEEIPEEAFSNHPKLHKVVLQSNKIRHISPNALKLLKSLNFFDLRHNLIDYWDENVLGDVVINTVYLDNNKIKCIDGDLKTVFKTVKVAVTFWGNDWDSDCPVKTDYFNENVGPPPMLDLLN